MSESEPKFVERVLTADSSRFKSAPEREEKLTAYQKKVRKDQEKKQQEKESSRKQSRKDRLAVSAPYPTNPPSKSQLELLSNDQILALEKLADLDNKREISNFKEILNITPRNPVPEGSEIIPYAFEDTPMELERSERREEFKRSQPNELKFDEIDMGFDLNEEIEERGGRKRRKSRKLGKSPKKLRKSRRKTTRKVRRHRRR